jgi:hypothetical protein
MKYNLLIMQIWAIIYKNTLNHLANKKKVFCEFVFPIIISAIYILTQSISYNSSSLSKFKSNYFNDFLNLT